ncbi:MAG TPA: fibronectin type III domain-containing protein, partial [Ilumatobacteraceae bacterium]|nr:fibronectin type III domain-containing protein [Ilumatobacteraceae bacterium]
AFTNQWQGRFVYVPNNPTAGWQTWDAMDDDLANGGWYASNQGASEGLCGLSALCTWSDLLTNWPGATITNPDQANAGALGQVAVRAGTTTEVGLIGGTFHVDQIVIGRPAGPNYPTTTYDFEPELPGAPTGVLAVAGNGQVTLSWTAPAYTGGLAITGYVVAGDGTCTPSPADATSCVVTGLTNGTEYSFTVAATNALGTGAASASASATPGAVPSLAQNLTATAGDEQVVLSWDAPLDDGGSPVTGYVVTTTGGSCAVSGLTATCTGLTNGTEYSFTVAATNSTGTGSATAPVTASSPTCRRSPPRRASPWPNRSP